MRLCFATSNDHKLSEVQQLIGNQFELVGLKQIGHEGDIPEDFDTMEENSMQKAQYINNLYRIACFADDSGLEVKALEGAPGVYSARYAGPQRSREDNNIRLISEMQGITDRSARFKAVISLIVDQKEVQFEGIVEGHIVNEMRGIEGFGYDPLFIPSGYDITFSEMGSEEKNKISHRGLAVKKLVNYLKDLNQ